jgi:WD40 repeat protein
VNPERGICQILRGESAVGLGFAIGPKHVVTCAHVVNVALGESMRSYREPGTDQKICLRFPIGIGEADVASLIASVYRWLPTSPWRNSDDIAVLELEEDAPEHVCQLNPRSHARDTSVQMWGPQKDWDTGAHVWGVLAGEIPGLMYQINTSDNSRFRVRKGFSGGPVWCRNTSDVVGILTAIGAGDGPLDAYMLPISRIGKIWPPELTPDAGRRSPADPVTAGEATIATATPPQRISRDSPVNALSWDPASGQRLAIADDKRTVQVYDVSGQQPTGGQSFRTGGPEAMARVYDVAFSSSGGMLAMAVSHPTLRAIMGGPWHGRAEVWDVSAVSPAVLDPDSYHDHRVNSVAFSPDGARLATGCGDNCARIWDLGTQQYQPGCGHDGAVTAVAYSLDDKRLATGSADCTAKTWDVTGQVLLLRLSHPGEVNAVTFSADGCWLATGSADGSARIWNSANGKEYKSIGHEGTVTAVAFSPDGRWLATGCTDQAARIWDAADASLRQKLPHQGAVTTVAFSPDGTRLATGSADQSVSIWNVGL